MKEAFCKQANKIVVKISDSGLHAGIVLQQEPERSEMLQRIQMRRSTAPHCQQMAPLMPTRKQIRLERLLTGRMCLAA